MSDRSVRAVLALVASCVLTVSCGQGTETGRPNEDAQDDRGPITYVQGKDPTGVVQVAVDAWNRDHPQETVTFLELPESPDLQRQQMVQNAQMRSDAFSVLSLDAVWTSEFAAHRWIDEIPREEFDLSNVLRPTIETASYRGRLYGIPQSSDGALLYYRTDLLGKVGAQPPRTWSQMWETCEKVRALPEARDIGCYAGQFEKSEAQTANFAEVVNSAGGAVLDESGRPTVNTPEAKKGLDFLVKGFRSGRIPRDAITFKEEEGRRAFASGKLLFHRQWAYQWSLVNKTDGSSDVAGKVGVAALPGLNGPGVSSLGGHNMAISTYARNKATARDFIRYFTAEKQQRLSLREGSLVPTLDSMYEDPELRREEPYLPVLKESIRTAQPRPRTVGYPKVTAAIQENCYAALTGAKTIEQALADLQSRLEELMQP